MSKILFVDDEPYPNRRVRRALEEMGFAVTICDTPLAAHKLMTTRADWSAVILDMMMPVPVEWQAEVKDGVTGIKLLTLARDWLVQQNIPVLIFTNKRTDLLKDRLAPLAFPPHLLARLEKDILLPKEVALRVFELAGAAQRGQPAGPGTWLP